MRSGFVITLLVLLGFGCGDDGGALDAASDASDAAADSTDPDGPTAPTLPAEAALPSLGPCPEGFRSFSHDDGVELCDPWPESGHAACSATEAHFVGTPGCARVGSACPSDGLPAAPPVGTTVHWVRAGAGGTGTRAAPFSTIAEAIGASSGGDVIAIGRGSYAESVVVPPGVSLLGACVEETVIRGAGSGPTIVVSGSGVGVSNLTVGPSASVGIEVAGVGRSLDVRDIVVRGVVARGLVATNGGQVTAHGLVIRDVASDGTRGPGLSAESGATIEGQGVVVDGSALIGLLATGAGTSVTLSDASISGTVQTTAAGVGVVINMGAAVEITRSAIEGNHGAGGIIADVGTTFVLSDSTIRENLPDDTGQFGRGLNVETGSRAELRRCLIASNRDVAFFVNATGDLDIEDSVVRDTESELRDERGGRGFEAQEGASITARRVVLTNNSETGALVSGGSTLTASDLVITRTRGRLRDGRFGLGMQVQTDASAELDRVRIEENLYLGLAVFQAGPVNVRDLTLNRTQPNSEGLYGRGVDAEDATVTIERALLVENRDQTLFASLGSVLDLDDITIRDTLEEAEGGGSGRGINYQQGAGGTVNRALVENSREVGIGVAALSNLVTLNDVVVRGVLPQACAATTCPGEDYGVGILATGSSAVRVSRFSVEGATLCGVQLADDGELDLEGGLVTGSTVGACVQVPGYDFDRLTDEVIYEGNDTNLDATSLPVPPPPSESGL